MLSNPENSHHHKVVKAVSIPSEPLAACDAPYRDCFDQRLSVN
jgi:hypothetical protein